MQVETKIFKIHKIQGGGVIKSKREDIEKGMYLHPDGSINVFNKVPIAAS